MMFYDVLHHLKSFEVIGRGAHHLILGVTAPLKVSGIAKMIYIQYKIVFAII